MSGKTHRTGIDISGRFATPAIEAALKCECCPTYRIIQFRQTTVRGGLEKPMHSSDWRSHQAHRLLQFGILLFLLALLIGLAVPFFTVPRVGLSAHLLGIMQGMFLIITGLLWTKLRLTVSMSRMVFCLLVYGCFAAWMANVLAGVWGAGSAMLPLAAGQVRGTMLQEAIIKVVLRTAAVSLIAAVTFIAWGLRTSAVDNSRK
jgi:(hydroxyamino)benzene mutase